jgi:hypothetical protein
MMRKHTQKNQAWHWRHMIGQHTENGGILWSRAIGILACEVDAYQYNELHEIIKIPGRKFT